MTEKADSKLLSLATVSILGQAPSLLCRFEFNSSKINPARVPKY
jgi:hypothetical protein